MLRKIMVTLSAILVAGMLLSACGPATTAPVVQPTAGVVKETVPVVETVVVPPTEVPPVVKPKTLLVCMGQEPDTLYTYGGSMLAAQHIQSAIYATINTVSFAYQPVIFTKLPSLSDGDAVINTVTVGPGDRIVDDTGNPVELTENPSPTIRLRPAGCYAADCAVDYVSGNVDMEQMAVTFKLVDGLTWADGTPVKASDMVYSFNLYMDPDTPTSSRYIGERTASYVATDDKTVVWTGMPGFRDSTYQIDGGSFQPLPEHQLGSMTAAELVNAEETSRTPMGYYAYTVQEWVAGDHVTVVKNPYYFRAAEGLPHLDTIIYRFVGEDANTAIASLLAGECDILTQDLSLDSVAPLMLELEAKGQMEPYFVTGTAFEHLDYGILPVESYERPDFFSDIRMRQAIAMCLNRQEVIDELLFGRSQTIEVYLPPSHPLYYQDAPVINYDPAASQALLEEMGWTDTDGDGIREAQGVAGIPDGTKLSFSWASTTAALRVNYMQIFQANLKECGFDVILDNEPSTQYFADGPDGPVFGRHFDVCSFTWLTGVEPPCNLYLTDQIPSDANGWAGQNDIGWSNADFDLACNSALQSLPGTPEYTNFHLEAQKIFAENLPSFMLYLRLKIAATRPEVTGFIMDPTANSEFFNVENFDINR
jgi:peptide/nickel transport system substrate-binding protein